MISEPRRTATLDSHSDELQRGRKNGSREASPCNVAVFANSEAGRKAKWLFAALLMLLLAANGLTIVNSFVGRNFMTAIADRREAEFVRQAIFYVGVGEGAVDIQSDDAHAASVFVRSKRKLAGYTTS